MKSLNRIVRTAVVGLVLAGVSAGFLPVGVTVGLITKYVLVVEKKSQAESWEQVGKGSQQLSSGDQVKTGEKSLAVIKFTDNSILRVREKTELTVNGELAGSAFSKNVDIEQGKFGFDVKKQVNEKFIFRSPTSVASIRGTKGTVLEDKNGMTVLVTEGLVNLKNRTTNQEVDIPAGSIGFSGIDGTVTVRQATEEELNDAQDEGKGPSENELNLELKDPQGNKKELKIKYKK